MKRTLIFGFALMLGADILLAQTMGTEAKSPKEVVEQFLKMETQGGRITPEGWRKASTFFVRPSRPSRDIRVFVVYRDYAVWNPVIKGTTATVMMDIYSEGRIDSALRYTPPDAHSYKSGIMFKLVLTDKYWELGPHGNATTEVAGPREWRIDEASPMLVLNAQSAIRYVNEMRDRTTDPVTKKNARTTLLALKHLR